MEGIFIICNISNCAIKCPPSSSFYLILYLIVASFKYIVIQQLQVLLLLHGHNYTSLLSI